MTRDAVPASDLARLLETERRLEERLRAARDTTERLVVGAQAAAQQRESAVAAELELEQRRLAEALDADRQTQERDIAAAADRQAAAFTAIPVERVTAVARDLARRFFTGPPS